MSDIKRGISETKVAVRKMKGILCNESLPMIVRKRIQKCDMDIITLILILNKCILLC